MKTPSDDHDLIRWMDGEMNETERVQFEERLKNDPALAGDAESMRALSTSLRAHLPSEMKVPHADFFNSQIQVRIAQLENEGARSIGAQEGGLVGFFNFRWLHQPWFAAAAAAVVVLTVLWIRPPSGSPSESIILSSYTPDIRVHAHAYHDEAADATVLMLDGLDAVPADRKISGISVKRSVAEPEFASTTLYGADGAALAVISRDALGNPLIWSKTPRG